MRRHVAWAGLLLAGLLTAGSLQAQTAARRWDVRVPAPDAVAYRGMPNFDNLGGAAGGMMYPAPNVVGLLAAVLTHAAINESVKSAERAKLQEDADKVLLPLKPQIDGFTQGELIARALPRMTTAGDKRAVAADAQGADGVWTVEVVPVYSVTPDSRALRIDAMIKLWSAPGKPSFEGEVMVLSAPRQGNLTDDAWTQADALRNASAQLWAQAVDIAVAQAEAISGGEERPHRTMRYLEGLTERIERAQLLTETCERVLVRNLRGTLMSVPRSSLPDDCPPPAPTVAPKV